MGRVEASDSTVSRIRVRGIQGTGESKSRSPEEQDADGGVALLSLAGLAG